MADRPRINITTQQKFNLRNALADYQSNQGANVHFIEPGTKTMGVSITPSISITPSVTPSISITPSISVTPSVSISRTPSISLSATPSISVTPSVSVTRTPSISITPSISVTRSVSITPSISVTSSISVTPSITISATPSVSVTATPSISITPSISVTSSVSVTPSVSITPSITPSTSPIALPPATGSQVTYAPATFFDAFTSQSAITASQGISTNNGAWQLFYANQATTIMPIANNIGLNSYAVGGNSWTWYAAVASADNSTGSWGAVQTISANTSYTYTAGGFNPTATTSSVTIPANRYFLIANSGGPFYRTVRTLSNSRTAMVSGSAMVTAINRVALGNWPTGGTTTIPTAFGGSDSAYTLYTGSVHVMSAKFVRTSDYSPLTGSLIFNGTNQYLSYSPGFTFGAGAFTLEGWFFNNSGFTTKGIVGAPVTSPVGALNLFFANSTTITSDKNGGGGQFSYTMPSAISTNVWHHFIYNRNSNGTTAVYIDGIRSNTQTDSLNYDTATDVVGRYYGGYWPGYWTNMRITIGTAVYDSAQTTQPYSTAPLNVLANTKYLMLAANITTDTAGIQTITNNNTVTRSSALKPF